MPVKKKAIRTKLEIDSQQLIEKIRSGLPQKEIMEKFGIKTSTQSKITYVNPLIGDGKVKEDIENWFVYKPRQF